MGDISDYSKQIKAIERKNRIEQGYFDGRFRPKRIKNKKKEKNKYKSREKGKNEIFPLIFKE